MVWSKYRFVDWVMLTMCGTWVCKKPHVRVSCFPVQGAHPRRVSAAGGDWTVSLTDGSLTTLEGIQLQLAANLVGPNVQISGIDASSINNITLQVARVPWCPGFAAVGAPRRRELAVTRFSVALQIDPSILQQTLQQGNLLSQQLPGEPGLASQNSSLQAQDGTAPASVVIQPIPGLSLQPTVTSASLTIGPLAEQDPVMTTSSSGE